MILKKYREIAGYSQGRIARELGIKRETITGIEKGRSHPSVKLAKRLGKLLHFQWEELFDDIQV